MVSTSGSGGISGSGGVPCRTLYVRNLCEKPKKHELRHLLHAHFSAHGSIRWISVSKTLKLRGQAFITFEDVNTATAVMHKLQGTSFLERPLSIQYAHAESDKASSDRAAARRARHAAAEQKDRSGVPPDDDGMDLDVEMEEAAGQANEATVVTTAPPNRILFIERLPDDTRAEELSELFGRFAGFVEVRSVPGKKSIAFVEFEQDAHAAVAMSGTQGHVMRENTVPISVSYAKK